MTSVEVIGTAVASPIPGDALRAITYTKSNAGDTLVVSTAIPELAGKTIYYATARVDAAGADDPCTWSGLTVTFTTGTGAGRILIYAK